MYLDTRLVQVCLREHVGADANVSAVRRRQSRRRAADRLVQRRDLLVVHEAHVTVDVKDVEVALARGLEAHGGGVRARL